MQAGEPGELGAGDERRRVGAHTEEGHVAEVEQAGEADDDVQTEGDGGEDEDVDAEVRVVVVGLGERDRSNCGTVNLIPFVWASGASKVPSSRSESRFLGSFWRMPSSEPTRSMLLKY